MFSPGGRRRPQNPGPRTSLTVQWLRLHASSTGTRVRSLVGELRSYEPCGRCGQKKNPGLASPLWAVKLSLYTWLARFIPRRQPCSASCSEVEIHGTLGDSGLTGLGGAESMGAGGGEGALKATVFHASCPLFSSFLRDTLPPPKPQMPPGSLHPNDG